MNHVVIIVIMYEALQKIEDDPRLAELKQFMLECDPSLFNEEQVWDEGEKEDWHKLEEAAVESMGKERFIAPPSAEDLAEPILREVGEVIGDVDESSLCVMEELADEEDLDEFDEEEDSFCELDFNAEGNVILCFDDNDEALKFLRRWVPELEHEISAFVQGTIIEPSAEEIDYKALRRSTKEYNRLEKQVRQALRLKSNRRKNK